MNGGVAIHVSFGGGTFEDNDLKDSIQGAWMIAVGGLFGFLTSGKRSRDHEESNSMVAKLPVLERPANETATLRATGARSMSQPTRIHGRETSMRQ